MATFVLFHVPLKTFPLESTISIEETEILPIGVLTSPPSQSLSPIEVQKEIYQ
jgi:hypothetical protein